MTENEAKGFIQGKLDCMNKCDVFDCKGTDECDGCNYCYSQGNFGEQKKTLETAIKALEEIQQYRAIGLTPELIEAMRGHNIAMINDLEEYQTIGTIEELKALKEKIAKIEFILNEKNYIKADECDYGNYYTCENALMIKDIEEIING